MTWYWDEVMRMSWIFLLVSGAVLPLLAAVRQHWWNFLWSGSNLAVNPRRTDGSDGIPWDVVKACVKQLSGNPHHAVQPLPDSCHHSHLSALAIISILQKTGIDRLNDYRPIALTSVAMKCFKQKAQQQLHFLRILRKNNLDPKLPLVFYHTSVESEPSYCLGVLYSTTEPRMSHTSRLMNRFFPGTFRLLTKIVLPHPTPAHHPHQYELWSE